MKLNNEIAILDITGRTGIIHPVLLFNEGKCVLIDTGLPNQLDQIEAAVITEGFRLDQIDLIIFTHQDLDHIGSAKQIREKVPKIKIMAYVDEVPFIQGDQTPTKIAEMERCLDDLSEDRKQFYDFLKSGFTTSFIHITESLKHSQILDLCGGIEIIHTPGHTPGHICLYLRKHKILICGDALNIENGQLIGCNPIYTANMKQSQESIKKLATFDVETILTYHGGAIGNGNQALAELIESFDAT